MKAQQQLKAAQAAYPLISTDLASTSADIAST